MGTKKKAPLWVCEASAKVSCLFVSWCSFLTDATVCLLPESPEIEGSHYPMSESSGLPVTGVSSQSHTIMNLTLATIIYIWIIHGSKLIIKMSLCCVGSHSSPFLLQCALKLAKLNPFLLMPPFNERQSQFRSWILCLGLFTYRLFVILSTNNCFIPLTSLHIVSSFLP